LRFILASESPRRVDLLRQAGFDFEVQKSGYPEVLLEDPVGTVRSNALGKARKVALAHPGRVVLGADTVVYIPGERVLGQATGERDVRRMLGMLRGRWHEVYSGVAVARGEDVRVGYLGTRVKMRELEEEEFEAYVALGEGVGKAGGYAIQGRAALFVEEIRGDYTNVVGLPLVLASRLLKGYGVRWYGSAATR
jgi:septum formation protein